MEVIIVGAGIAGLSAGIALRRAGHKITVRFSIARSPFSFTNYTSVMTHIHQRSSNNRRYFKKQEQPLPSLQMRQGSFSHGTLIPSDRKWLP